MTWDTRSGGFGQFPFGDAGAPVVGFGSPWSASDWADPIASETGTWVDPIASESGLWSDPITQEI